MRFLHDTKKNTAKNFLLPLLVFLIVVAVFYYGVNAMSIGSTSRQKDVLEQAVYDSVIYCYSVEGSYPEDVAYMEKNYGLTYDKDKFFVGYRLQGSNLMPEITIIELGENADAVAGLGGMAEPEEGGLS